jgi:hypothetical protein
MRRAWLNEQYAPELLMFEKDLVAQLLQRIQHQVSTN